MSGPVNQRFDLLALVLSLLFFWLFGCSRRVDPQKTFEHAQETFTHGDLVAAQTEADIAYRRFSGGDQEWAWKFRLLDAEILVDQGQSEAARVLLDATLPPELARTDLAVNQEMLQGSAYIPLDRVRAEQSLNAAEELCETLHSSLAGKIARARGALERHKNNLEGARRFFRQSLQLARQRHDVQLEMTDLSNLGAVSEGEERYDEAIDWSSDAYRTAQILHDRYTGEAAQGNLAWAYYKMGDFDRAQALLQEAEKTARDLGVGDRVLWLNHIGLVYYQWNQLSLAEDYYRKSLALAQVNQNSEQIIDALTSLAFVSVQKGQLAEAKKYSEGAFRSAHAENDRASELYPRLVEGQVAAAQGDYKQAKKIFHEVANDKQSDLSLRWEAQNDLARLYEQQHRFADANNQYQEALATIEQARSSLRHEEFKLPFLANAAHLYDDYIRFLVAQGKTDQALRQADYSRARTLAEGLDSTRKSAAVPALPNVRQLAHQTKATILFYWLGRERSYLWAIDAKSTTLYSLPPAGEIDAAVQRYGQALRGGWQDVLDSENQDGIHLYETLVKPASKQIAPNSRVILITDGSLDSLNFETLLVAEPKMHYWIEDVTLMSASSLRVLAASQTHGKKNTGKLLLIGDAVTSSRDYAQLPNAEQEIEDVGKHFAADARQTYTHAQATPTAYLASNPGRFSFIHFVAHATASKLSPLDSAIILSPASPEQDSFKLYARDITQHGLSADLVTISSCNGAGTQAYSGEGLVGLSWAFLRAGAHNVIGALWEVSDASTARLMDKLYAELERGRPPEVALRSAKLSLLRSDDVFRKPFYWAPFQLYTGR
jgi:CHAT domain-containing protein